MYYMPELAHAIVLHQSETFLVPQSLTVKQAYGNIAMKRAKPT
jgi:hypothetical protein